MIRKPLVTVAALSVLAAPTAAAAPIGDYLAHDHVSQIKLFAHSAGAPEITFAVPDNWVVDFSTTYYEAAHPKDQPKPPWRPSRSSGSTAPSTAPRCWTTPTVKRTRIRTWRSSTRSRERSAATTPTSCRARSGVSHVNYYSTQQTVFAPHE